MIVVKIELWRGGYESDKVEIGRMTITNRGDGSSTRGNYDVHVLRKGTEHRVQRTGEVLDHPRLSASVWNLVAKALRATGLGVLGLLDD